MFVRIIMALRGSPVGGEEPPSSGVSRLSTGSADIKNFCAGNPGSGARESGGLFAHHRAGVSSWLIDGFH